jgi:phosphoglycerate dehydrogenase-like enzyme
MPDKIFHHFNGPSRLPHSWSCHELTDLQQPTPVHILFADHSFPDARRCLKEAAPNVTFGIRGSGAESWQSPILVPLMSRISGGDMDSVGGLRIIHQWGAGLEGVDVAAASVRGIAVANVPTSQSGGAESVAEWCVMSALVLSRRATELTGLMRSGGTWGTPMGRAMLGRTACIIGLGDIGKALAARLAPFGMTLIAVSRAHDETAAKAFGCHSSVGFNGLEHVLPMADYVFLCLPLTPATRHLMNRATLSAMSRHSYLINPGRGGLVDQDALLAAIDAGQIAGCALDVFTPEPLDKDSPLLQRPNILATPHIAGITDYTYGQIAKLIETAHLAVRAGRIPANCVNQAEVQHKFKP